MESKDSEASCVYRDASDVLTYGVVLGTADCAYGAHLRLCATLYSAVAGPHSRGANVYSGLP